MSKLSRQVDRILRSNQSEGIPKQRRAVLKSWGLPQRTPDSRLSDVQREAIHEIDRRHILQQRRDWRTAGRPRLRI